ncbi:hypothetical protein RJ641_030062 [Dillenia turbinata]|uniref:Uncharacterized protein n=1 Tax=Dillenia turbinata TaxID=194707 RepID=A0AAN8ZJV0_9MAGN
MVGRRRRIVRKNVIKGAMPHLRKKHVCPSATSVVGNVSVCHMTSTGTKNVPALANALQPP